MKSLVKNISYAFLIFLLLAALFSLFTTHEKKEEISFAELVEQVKEGQIEKIVVKEDEVNILLKDGTKEFTYKQAGVSLEEMLKMYGVTEEQLLKANITSERKERSDIFWFFLASVLPIVLIGFFFWWILKQGQQGAAQALSFGKIRARRYGVGGRIQEKVTFKDVADLEEAKTELKEVVEFLRNPKKFTEIGARIPRGVLLLGPPGVGKTLLARAVASEAGVPFFSVSGSEFVEMFVGVGSSRVRDLFTIAKKNSPCIVFIDELDAIGRHRGAGIGGGHDEREQTLNQILVEMDGMERNSGVIVLAATNRPDILDPALLRPGRFDRRVVLDMPDTKGREEILKIHTRKKPLAKDVNLREIAERTPGFSGADLANLANEAAILAARRNKKEISQKEFLESIEKVLLGPERKSHILSKEEKKIAAYHEAGHALVSTFSPETEPIRKISIISRGLAAGYTLRLPEREKYLKTKTQFLSELATLLGGYVAEKLKFKEITTGAADDLRKASELARKLVMEYGMSRLGPMTFGKKESLVFLGKEITEQRNFSEEVAERIDEEVERFVKEAYKRAEKILKTKRALLEKIANRLIEKETIEREEFEKLIEEEKNKFGKRSKSKKTEEAKI
ncbi:ATP-dependent zinc metalloprotease FtsH [bacterium]|nr:ATP-dependent zinc metalloprotease FtsH [bacterium]